MITKEHFDILTLLEVGRESLSISSLYDTLKRYQPVEIDNAIDELQKNELLCGLSLTKKAYDELEPYRVKRAIFLAAGFGSRMLPLTKTMPKPMAIVRGKHIIETLIDAVIQAGIEEIIIVRGYLGEQFDALLEKYPNITFIENKDYDKSNNILSAMLVGDKLCSSYVFEADLFLLNKSLITKYQYSSNYLGVKVDHTDDWCFTTDSNGRITSLKKVGDNCYHMYGVSYISRDDGKRLAEDIKNVYERYPESHQRFWDEVGLDYCIDDYTFSIRPCSFADIAELDTHAEMLEFDKNKN